MVFDHTVLRNNSISLAHQKDELSAVRQALVSYQNSIPTYWVGMEASLFADASWEIAMKIDRLIMTIDSAAHGLNAAAERSQVEQATETTGTRLDNVTGGGGFGAA